MKKKSYFIEAVERWTKENKLILIKKKSAIYVSFLQWEKIHGFPVVKQYGIIINNWLKKYFNIKTLIQLCEYFQMSRMTYGATFFLQSNILVNYIGEVCYNIMRNIIGLGKGTSKSRFIYDWIVNGSFRNTMMIRLLKLSKNIEFILMNILIY